MDPEAEKPLDLGNGRLAASFDRLTAAWLSLGATNANVGFVELSALPTFDEAARGNAVATRQHRLALTRADHAFLRVLVDGRPPDLVADSSAVTAPAWSGDDILVRADAATDCLRQHWSIPAGRALRLEVRGRLDRPALAEITEVDPPAPTGATSIASLEGEDLVVRTDALGVRAMVRVRGAAVRWDVDSDVATATLQPDGDGRSEVTIEMRLDDGTGLEGAQPLPGPSEREPLVARALAYVRGCTALAVAGDERAILTDHRILPLSWTRDAYWQALALLAADGPGDRERVADHLRWLWRRCERPDGRWVRSHHANGLRKDLAFQADQQLYPLIELADFWRLTGGVPSGVDWPSEVARAWDAALDETDASTGLIASTENAADDPAAAPFIASSQILLWYAARRLSELAGGGALDLDPAALRTIAARTRTAFDGSFAAWSGPWPYAVDGQGGRVAYHDANDLPVALAPLWGFCDADDPGWSATMQFAFSPANPAFVALDDGHGGLGSAHTPGAWTLGDLQAWIRARTLGDEEAASAAAKRLAQAAFADGMLPEAYGPNGMDRVRHWFAWPGSVWAALTILDGGRRLEATIRA